MTYPKALKEYFETLSRKERQEIYNVFMEMLGVQRADKYARAIVALVGEIMSLERRINDRLRSLEDELKKLKDELGKLKPSAETALNKDETKNETSSRKSGKTLWDIVFDGDIVSDD